jgi:hypothetical protein
MYSLLHESSAYPQQQRIEGGFADATDSKPNASEILLEMF